MKNIFSQFLKFLLQKTVRLKNDVRVRNIWFVRCLVIIIRTANTNAVTEHLASSPLQSSSANQKALRPLIEQMLLFWSHFEIFGSFFSSDFIEQHFLFIFSSSIRIQLQPAATNSLSICCDETNWTILDWNEPEWTRFNQILLTGWDQD